MRRMQCGKTAKVIQQIKNIVYLAIEACDTCPASAQKTLFGSGSCQPRWLPANVVSALFVYIWNKQEDDGRRELVSFQH